MAAHTAAMVICLLTVRKAEQPPGERDPEPGALQSVSLKEGRKKGGETP